MIHTKPSGIGARAGALAEGGVSSAVAGASVVL
jgi:hypothetical protein